MQIEQIQIEQLKEYGRNSRTHDKAQIQAVADSIKEFGFTNPLLVRDDMTIIAGHGRLAAARLMGLTQVPCIRLSHLTPDQARAYVIADNALAEQAGWDKETLKLEICDLQLAGFNLDLLGLDNLDALLAQMPGQEGNTDPDAIPDTPAEPKAQRGQVWSLGAHRLMCGDSTSIEDVNILLGGGKVDTVYTDPPYGINVVRKGTIGGGKSFGKNGFDGIIPAGNYAPIIGDDTIDAALAAYDVCIMLKIKSILLWGGNFYAHKLPPAKCWVIWDKETDGNFGDGEVAWSSYDKSIRIFRHKWSGMIKASEHGQKRVHPTQKPVALAEWAFNEFSTGKTVLDLFLGSGTTLIAAEKTGRICYGMELSEHYCDVIITRWENFTGKKAELITP